MKKLSSKKKMKQIRMLNKNIQKMNLRKSKRVKDAKKATEKKRLLPRNRQVYNYKRIINMTYIVIAKFKTKNYVRDTCYKAF